MNIANILPFFTGIVMAALTADVYRRYLSHNSGHSFELVWAIGLTMFTLATLAEAILGLTWNSLAFRAWYLFGAILSAAWIGQGTILLLFRRPWARILTVILALTSLAVAILLFATPVIEAAYKPGVPIGLQYRDLLPEGAPVRLTTIPFNIYGTIALVGGALWSGYLFWRRRVLPNRVIGNVLIAAGALAIASASSLARLGNGEFLSLGQLIFAILIYVGLILSSKPTAEEITAPSTARTVSA